MKKKTVLKWTGRILLILLVLLLLFTLVTFIVHRVKTSQEVALLKEKGYYNPVSVGDYSLNTAIFGNPEGEHTIVGLAGLGMGDYAVTARQMTACLEEKNKIVFIDRAGYGFSDDTENDMTLEYIVEDYRKALQNAGIEGPYILMPHSIGGAYANYWVSHYPEEIEGIVFVDGSQLSADAFSDEESYEIGVGDRFLAVLAKLGFSRYVLREYQDLYPDHCTEEEQYLGDALTLMTLDSLATTSESGRLGEIAHEAFDGIVTNDVPKLYICASWGVQTKEDLIERNKWRNRQIEINDMDMEPFPLEYTDAEAAEILQEYEEARQDILVPYIEKMGSCELVCLVGDHLIYQQKPEECGEIIKEFIAEMEQK